MTRPPPCRPAPEGKAPFGVAFGVQASRNEDLSGLAPAIASASTTSMKTPTQPKTITDQLRAEIRRAKKRLGLSRYAIAKQLAYSEGSIGNFMAGRQRIGSDVIDAIGEMLGLRLVVDPRRQPRRKAP